MYLLILIAFLALPPAGGEVLVRQAAIEAIEARGADSRKIEVEVLRVTGINGDDGHIRVELSGNTVPRARTQVRVVRETSDGASESGWALLNISHFDSVAVSNNGVSGGDDFNPSTLHFEWMDITAFRGRPLLVSDVAALASDAMWARSIPEGRPIRFDDLRAPFAAETGDTVLMEYNRNGLVLRLSCRARESGSVGDVIRLYSSETRTTYRARLTGPGTATWIETRS